MTYETLLSDIVEPGVRKITLNRPKSLNAMNRQLVRDVAQAFREAGADPETRAILFTGNGRAFCAGDDRNEHIHPENEAEARLLVNDIQAVSHAILFGDKPVVGAINGWAAGGGMEWAINCDFPVWAESAKGFFPEVSLNVFVTGGVTSLLPALVGLQKAREMLYFGEKYDARTLLGMGVAWKVVADEQLQDEALGVARKLAALPSLAVRSMKRTLSLHAVTDMHAAMVSETNATVAAFLDPETTRLIQNF
ncbi:enoyl-CoA hydratase/isomerase family protein [Oceanibacterium hippocampi]|uniref:Putative enoyl-CoA hydratase echA8 n=1 Tax=Oceanibacterium hippocampi TaxID=745714 RepID=A0A1Y5U378_9PROT|nr:enoyl-CoA hydratase/isomerase family protein [Oceanibacterium hippocampi]SLN77699.1 putative enoyl-CoA hydratase echA8 [Oceanibacterium hippocampi]